MCPAMDILHLAACSVFFLPPPLGEKNRKHGNCFFFFYSSLKSTLKSQLGYSDYKEVSDLRKGNEGIIRLLKSGSASASNKMREILF